MEDSVRSQVRNIHLSNSSSVLAITGGGVSVLGWITGESGASDTLLDAHVPYSSGALVGFLGREIDKSVSGLTAKSMAKLAYEKAVCLASGDRHVIGIGCTAAISTNRARKGEHGCFVAAWTSESVVTYSLKLTKGAREREDEEDVVSKLVLRALAEGSSVDFELSEGLIYTDELEIYFEDHCDQVSRVLKGEIPSVTIRHNGKISEGNPSNVGVLSGSFNPIHDGHRRLLSVASDMLGLPVLCELSVTNVDKPVLNRLEVQRRLGQLVGIESVVTRATTFSDKARLFRDSTFVIGWDTFVRLLNPVYYRDKQKGLTKALDGIGHSGCKFLVAGRLDGGVFRTFEDKAIPPEFKEMFSHLPESRFRYDSSSTEIRAISK